MCVIEPNKLLVSRERKVSIIIWPENNTRRKRHVGKEREKSEG